MRHIGIKLSVPSAVTTIGATGVVHLGRVVRGGEENGVAT